MVFDGEVCVVDDNGVEDFQGIMKEIKRKDHTIKNPKYKVFDYLMLDEFDNQKSERKLSDRLTCFNMIYDFSKKELKCIDVLTQWGVKSEEHFQELAELATFQKYPELAAKLAELMPMSAQDVRAVLASRRISVEDSEIDQALVIIRQHVGVE